MVVGCGQGIVNVKMSEQEINAEILAIDAMDLKATVAESKVAIDTAQSALAVVVDPVTGSFNWDIFLGGVNFAEVTANTKACLTAAFPKTNILLRVFTAPKDIAKGLKCILDDVMIAVGVANTNLDLALETLNKALLSVTPGSAQEETIKTMIDQIIPLKASFKLALQTMAGHLTVVTVALNQLPTLATGAVPVPVLSLLVGYTVGNFVQPIIFEIMSFQARINAL